ncbi:hypothetical protein [Nocardia tengchongensis]|uniref:hypothetical protein n=1 Tax=Nocardia tengchongensis TaxID=2055889 RepID=UPI003650CABB
MTKIFYEIDGEPVSAEKCMWVLIAPCGCECAWSVAKYWTTEDEAWDGFSRSKAVRRRDEKLGFRVEIKRSTEIRIKDDCPHVPKFGVEPRPELEGHTWAVKSEGRVQHLVPLVIEKNSLSPRNQGLVRAICGRSEDYIWSTWRSDLDGRVECTACVKAAKGGAE